MGLIVSISFVSKKQLTICIIRIMMTNYTGSDMNCIKIINSYLHYSYPLLVQKLTYFILPVRK